MGYGGEGLGCSSEVWVTVVRDWVAVVKVWVVVVRD